MENAEVLVDTSVLIEYFRKKNKEKTFLYNLSLNYEPVISVITKYEFLSGINDKNFDAVNEILNRLKTLDFDSKSAEIASEIFRNVKVTNHCPGIADIFIASAAIKHSLKLATFNVKHFTAIPKIKILDIHSI